MSEINKYGINYQDAQIIKHRNRKINYWKARINLLHNLIEKYCLPRLKKKEKKEIITVDIGCSIGTIAIELANAGFNSYGIDFDDDALEIARKLSKEEAVSVNFQKKDVTNWKNELSSIDIAVCFDIFEHLQDDEIGSLLQSIKNKLSSGGSLIFHTFPLEYDYLFYNSFFIMIPLIPFSLLPKIIFSKIAKMYAAFIDILLLLTTGSDYRSRLESASHCNPTSLERLKKIFERSGYALLFINSDNLYPFKKFAQKIFFRHIIARRNLFGVAIKKVI